MYANNELEFSNRTETYNRPNMCAHTHRTEAYKRSIRYRRYKIWNSLPKDWEMKEMSYDTFKSLARKHVTEHY